MTQTTVPFQPKQSNHGHKRKGKPVEAWMLELEKAQDEENRPQSLDFIAIEQIANGVEQMVFSWGLQMQERGEEYTKLLKPLVKENSHVSLLPWSLNKTEELSTSESDLETKNGTTKNSDSMAKQPQVCTNVIGIKHASPKHIYVKERKNRWLDSFNRSLLPVTALENPQSLKVEDLPQVNSCHGVLTSSNRMKNCIVENKRGMVHEFENIVREDSIICQTMIPEQESRGGSMELEVEKDNCMNSNISIPATRSLEMSKKEGHDPFNAKDGELGSWFDDRSSMWILKAKAATPTLEKSQQSIMNLTTSHYLPSILTCGPTGNASLLLSQSRLCTQSPSLRLETALSSEIISSTHDEVFINLEDLSMGLPMYENRLKGLIPLLPFLDTTLSCGEDTKSIEVGGHTIKVTTLRGGNDVLEDKFQALVNINACSVGVQEEHQLKPSPTSNVEELQIALLECAMEYEIKTIEAKMKMQEFKLKGQQNMADAKSKQPCPQKVIEPVLTCKKTIDNQRLQQLKKQKTKLQHEKNSVNNELHALRDKERQFERQKRSLEDALHRVNRLQREVMKKEHEVVEWQLKEKETKAQLQEVGEKLKRERHAQVSLPLEPKKLLNLLPALREWLRSLKKIGLAKAAERRQFQDKEEGDSIYPYIMDACNMQPSILHNKDKGMPGVPAHLGQLSEELAHQPNPTLSVNQVDVVICCLTKEIHALQKELIKLARS